MRGALTRATEPSQRVRQMERLQPRRMAGRIFASLLGCALLVPLSLRSQSEPRQEKLNVLILGDSLALCGFGKRLDERFREDPKVGSTYTYMACGTNPLSWLKHKPYTSIKAPCGFWSI